MVSLLGFHGALGRGRAARGLLPRSVCWKGITSPVHWVELGKNIKQDEMKAFFLGLCTKVGVGALQCIICCLLYSARVMRLGWHTLAPCNRALDGWQLLDLYVLAKSSH